MTNIGDKGGVSMPVALKIVPIPDCAVTDDANDDDDIPRRTGLTFIFDTMDVLLMSPPPAAVVTARDDDDEVSTPFPVTMPLLALAEKGDS